MKISIKRKLQISFTIIFLILAGAVCLFWRGAMSDMAEEKAISHFAMSINLVNDEMDNLLKEANYISLVLSINATDQRKVLTGSRTIENYSQLESERSLSRSISDFYSYRNYINSILLFGVNGNEFANGVTLPVSELMEKPWFEKLKQDSGDGVFLGTHANYTGGNTHEVYVLSAGRKIVDKEETIGYVLVDLSYDYMKRNFSSITSEGGVLLVVDEDGGIVYDSNSPYPSEERIENTPFRNVTRQIESLEGRFYFKTEETEYLTLYKTSEFTGWTSIFLIPKTSIMENVDQTMQMMIVFSVTLLIAGIFLIGYFSQYLTRNILKLKQYVDEAGENCLEEIPMIPSGDEIQELDASFNQMICRIRRLMEDLEERREKERNAQFQALYAQISPHFLSNTLNTIRFLAERQNAGNISELTASLITLLHYSMNNQKDEVLLKEEIEYIQNYLVIQEYRYYGIFEVKFEIEKETENCRILKFMIQPLVENSIIHGTAGLERPGKILIRIQKRGKRLVIEVIDNGNGFREERQDKDKTHGIGLENVRQRIELFYGPEYFLRIQSKEHHYTKVVLELPFLDGEEGKHEKNDGGR